MTIRTRSSKSRARERNAAIALAGRDIGELPAVENPDRKAKAAGSFRFFCEAYFSLTFHLAWSPDHLKVITKIEEAVVRGGLFSLAMARGSGKSSLAEVACIWAVLNGYRDFVCLIGSDEGHACDMLDSIKTELDGNDLLLADYPEVCFPIQALDGISNRANGQLYQGKRTQIGWTAKEIVLANDRRQQSQRRDHQSRRSDRSHPRHEIQTSRWKNRPAVARGSR